MDKRAEPGLNEEAEAIAAPEVQAGARSARLVGAGILLSRITGLVRERVFAHYFGTSLYADVFRGALRLPNVLQNLLGEGTLSASFIPVYAELIHQKKYEEAGRVAGAIFALLLAIAGALALIGVAFAPLLVDVFLAGFDGERRELAVQAVRIIFPMTGVLVLSAWSLGILNSHRRFFIPYVAPVLWNAAMIGALIIFGGRTDQRGLVIALAWGALIGGGLQFAIQLPWVLMLDRRLKLGWGRDNPGVRQTVRNAVPAIFGRGVVQVSGWIDLVLASFLAEGAIAAIGFAFTLYILPVSLFGMSVAAAELPELSRERGSAGVLQQRVNTGLHQIAFFILPSFIGYLVIGDIIVAALYQTGDFGRDDTMFVYVVLAGQSLGLLASTMTRMFSSTFFALGDTKTPARVALQRVLISTALAAALMLPFDQLSILGHPLGALGLVLAGALGAWFEWFRLRRILAHRIGAVGFAARDWLRMGSAALAGAGTARLVLWGLPALHPILEAVAALVPFAAVYFGLTGWWGMGEAARFLKRFRRAA